MSLFNKSLQLSSRSLFVRTFLIIQGSPTLVEQSELDPTPNVLHVVETLVSCWIHFYFLTICVSLRQLQTLRDRWRETIVLGYEEISNRDEETLLILFFLIFWYP
ncbi:unnamed protein product [Lathyrus oleraceus]